MKPGDDIKALPGPLPAGEHILWQGQPAWRSYARHVFHTRAVTLYFLVLMAWAASAQLADGQPLATAVAHASWLVPVGAIALALLFGLGWLMASTTIYTITNRHVILKYGIALPMTVTIPFQTIETAAYKAFSDGSGDIPLSVSSLGRLGFIHLWPNTRPWHVKQPQPMLRAVPDAASVARVLVEAMSQTRVNAATAVGTAYQPAPTPQPSARGSGAAYA